LESVWQEALLQKRGGVGREEENCGVAPKKPRHDGSHGAAIRKLLHQKHLARALDCLGKAALIMRGHAGVFAGKNAALIGHILAQ